MFHSDYVPIFGIHVPLIPKHTTLSLISVCLCLCMLVGACAVHYYRVTDPVTGKTYYTDDLKKIEGDGVELKDARTGETVTIQNSEVKEINNYEFDTARVQSGNTRL